MLQGLSRMAGEDGPGEVQTRDLEAPGPAGPIRVRLYSPPGAPLAALVYLHGGGWVAGGLDTHEGLCRRLAASSQAILIAVDYRLAPEHRFPAAFEDSLAAARWAAQQAPALGLDAGRLAIGGDSVGAGLAAAVAQSADAPPLALQVLLCPILDLANESPSRRAFAEGFFVDAATLAQDIGDYCGGGADLGDPRLSPLLAGDLSGQPPALIHAAEYDPFRDEAQAYAERLSAAGVSARFVLWPGMIHGFYTLPRAIAGAGPALEAIGAGIAEALA
jgi:acetyl esterase/lipase